MNRDAGSGLRVCMLGGTGFVGRHVAARLGAAGHRVLVPSRSAGSPPALRVLPQVRVVQADVHDPETLRRLVGGHDAVINLVGILNERGDDGSGFRRAHAELAARLVAACNDADVAKLVQMSALKADAERGPSHYLRTKGEAEERIRAGAQQFAWSIVRPSVIFGPGDSFVNRFAGLLRLAPGVVPLACAGARFAPAHVDDVAAAIVRCATDRGTDGRVFELCGPEVLTLSEIVQRIAAALGLRRRVVPLPDAAARLQARVMQRLPGKPFSMDNYRSLQVASVCTESGFAALGLEPRSFTQHLAEALGLSGPRQHFDSYRRSARR